MKNRVVDVQPEFLGDISKGVERVLQC